MCQHLEVLANVQGWHFRQVSGGIWQISVPAPFFEPFQLQLCAGILGLFFSYGSSSEKMSQNSANSLKIPGNPNKFPQLAKVITPEFARKLWFPDIPVSGFLPFRQAKNLDSGSQKCQPSQNPRRDSRTE
jgi:hypothetical protein